MAQALEQLSRLADHLHASRAHILQDWREFVAQDPELTTASMISRAQFIDHIPQVLDAFEHRLRAHDPDEKQQARVEQRLNAAEHGLHRWQQGYDLRETMREWGHLHLCVLLEIECFARQNVSLDALVLPAARAALVRLCGEGVGESAARYARLQQAEAAGRISDLERALRELRTLERERAGIWREAAHDLRGNVNVISNTSALVARHGIPERVRAQFSQVLQRNVGSLRELLGDLLDLARLEAGQERRRVAPFDAARLLKEFCESMRALAAERDLFLKTEGPASLPVEGDAVKVRRIVQNLVLNALKVTEQGGVRVTWEAAETGDVKQWVVCVQDTGPGFDPLHAVPLERVLKQATAASLDVEVGAERSGERAGTPAPAPTLASASESPQVPGSPGEGVGLSIVKRLCELLDASLELQTAPGSGTTFRVTLPRHYQVAGNTRA